SMCLRSTATSSGDLPMEHDPGREVVKLYIRPAGAGSDGTLDLRMTPAIADEVRTLLDEHGLTHSQAAEFSSSPELAIEAVEALRTLGGLTALAAVINAFLKRNDGKHIVLEPDRTEAKGYSKKEIEQIIEKQAQAQREVDEKWNQMKGQLPPREPGSNDSET
ncbi:MAG: hypothetical protein ACRDTJ_11775, partial [Pseudonocardiaceae bacterium]